MKKHIQKLLITGAPRSYTTYTVESLLEHPDFPVDFKYMEEDESVGEPEDFWRALDSIWWEPEESIKYIRFAFEKSTFRGFSLIKHPAATWILDMIDEAIGKTLYVIYCFRHGKNNIASQLDYPWTRRILNQPYWELPRFLHSQFGRFIDWKNFSLPKRAAYIWYTTNLASIEFSRSLPNQVFFFRPERQSIADVFTWLGLPLSHEGQEEWRMETTDRWKNHWCSQDIQAMELAESFEIQLLEQFKRKGWSIP